MNCHCPNCVRDWTAYGVYYCYEYEDFTAYTAGVVVARRKTEEAAQEAYIAYMSEVNRRNAEYAAMNALLDKAIIQLDTCLAKVEALSSKETEKTS